MNHPRQFFGTLLISVALLLAGCSGGTSIKSDLGIKGAPDWVNEGTQAVSDDGGRLIQGVGSAPPMGDEALQQSTADNRARLEIARVLATYVDATLKDYSSSRRGEADGQVSQSIASTTQQLLSGSKIMGRWKDPNTGTVYAFAEMDMEAVDDAIAAAGNLTTSFKQFYANQRSQGFERFIRQQDQ